MILRMAAVLYPRTPNGLLMVGRATEDVIRYGLLYLASIRESSSTAQSLWSDLEGKTAREEARSHRPKVPRGRGKIIRKRAERWGADCELKPWKRGFASFFEERKELRRRARHKTRVALEDVPG